jgi:hypothetical protein
MLVQWRRDVAFAGFDVPLQMDVAAEKMIFGVQGIDATRRDRLIKVSVCFLSFPWQVILTEFKGKSLKPWHGRV